MRYDNLVLDIDGTVLDDELSISENTVELIRRLKKKGITVIFCTGRMLDSAKHIIKKHFDSDDFPIVSYNGSLITLPGIDEPIFHHFIDQDSAVKIIEYLRNKRCHRQAYINNQIIVEEDNPQIKRYAIHAGVGYKVVNDLATHIKAGLEVDKILAINDEKELSIIEEESLILFSEKVNVFKSFSIYLDYIPKTTDKGKAVLELLEYLNLDPKRTIMIGDGDNDVYAFKVVGYSIAMANATEKLKREADLCLEKTNNQEGVYHILNHIFSELLL